MFRLYEGPAHFISGTRNFLKWKILILQTSFTIFVLFSHVESRFLRLHDTIVHLHTHVQNTKHTYLAAHRRAFIYLTRQVHMYTRTPQRTRTSTKLLTRKKTGLEESDWQSFCRSVSEIPWSFGAGVSERATKSRRTCEREMRERTIG